MAATLRILPESGDQMLNSRQAADVIGYSPSHLARLRMHGGGPPFAKRFGAKQSHVRYRRSDLEAWLRAQMRSSEVEQ